MASIQVTRRINKDATTIWPILADFADIAKFNPFLAHSALIGERSAGGTCGVGTHRQCDMKFGNTYLREEIVEWKEGESYTAHIYESMMPVTKLFTTIGVKPAGKSESIVYMKSTYEPKLGFAGAIMDRIFLRWIMLFMFARVLKGLEAYSAKQP